MQFPTRHQLLRDRRSWLGTMSGLRMDRDGALTLARMPGPSSGKAVEIAATYPYAREVSGILPGPCQALFVSDTAHDRVLFIDGQCSAQTTLWGATTAFNKPRGLALVSGVLRESLVVADTDNARVQNFALPLLEANYAWSWTLPTSVAADTNARLLVIDAAAQRLHRLDVDGNADGAFDATLLAQGKLQQPLHVACGIQDCVYVSDGAANQVFAFDANGLLLAQLVGPSGWLPGAICVDGSRVYAADAATGSILIFENFQFIAVLQGWRGPVTAMALDADGNLFIKPALDATYFRFEANSNFVPSGFLVAGPFDAGEDREWARAWIDAQIPDLTDLDAEMVLKATASDPTAAQWLPLPAMDTLLSTQTHDDRRFIWMRLTLATQSAQMTPTLQQARAATDSEDLLDYLPLTYARNDAATSDFLFRWLQLISGQFQAIEEALDDMPRLIDSRLASPSTLAWVARWLGLELPVIASDEDRRLLIARAVSLFARRGTRENIAQFVELHTGIRPAVLEAWTDRSIWILGESSRLDFETRLPSLDPLGMVVPDEAAAKGCCIASEDEPRSGCQPCASESKALPTDSPIATPIGRALVGESGPLASNQIGTPLFDETAYRFCVVVDRYRAAQPETLAEIARIVDREKPAHTDYRIELIDAQTRVGLQSCVGIDTIVGGDPPPLRLDAARLDIDTYTPPSDLARIGSAAIDGLLALT